MLIETRQQLNELSSNKETYSEGKENFNIKTPKVVDPDFLKTCHKMRSLLFKHLVLKLTRKVFLGVISSQEALDLLGLTSNSRIVNIEQSETIDEIIISLEKMIDQRNDQYNFDEEKDILSSLRFYRTIINHS